MTVYKDLWANRKIYCFPQEEKQIDSFIQRREYIYVSLFLCGNQCQALCFVMEEKKNETFDFFCCWLDRFVVEEMASVFYCIKVKSWGCNYYYLLSSGPKSVGNQCLFLYLFLPHIFSYSLPLVFHCFLFLLHFIFWHNNKKLIYPKKCILRNRE